MWPQYPLWQQEEQQELVVDELNDPGHSSVAVVEEVMVLVVVGISTTMIVVGVARIILAMYVNDVNVDVATISSCLVATAITPTSTSCSLAIKLSILLLLHSCHCHGHDSY